MSEKIWEHRVDHSFPDQAAVVADPESSSFKSEETVLSLLVSQSGVPN